MPATRPAIPPAPGSGDPRAATTALAAIAAGGLVAVAFAGCGLVGPRPCRRSARSTSTRRSRSRRSPSRRVDADGTRVFTLDAQAGTTEFEPGVRERHVGLQRLLPRPDPRRRSAASACASTCDNSLDEPTTVHWHGMHLPAEMDGGPHQMVEPDATWSPEWTIDQPAATLWYHPHPHGETESHVARGLAGMFLVQDDAGGGARRCRASTASTTSP